MEAGTVQQIQGLSRMTVGELRKKYLESLRGGDPFVPQGVPVQADRMASAGPGRGWPLGAGPAAEQARTTAGRLSPSRDRRLPLPGTLLVRAFQGRDLVVQVLDDGFAFEGRRYRSLSAIARQVTGSQWNGFAFFGLTRGKKRRNHNRGSGKGNA